MLGDQIRVMRSGWTPSDVMCKQAQWLVRLARKSSHSMVGTSGSILVTPGNLLLTIMLVDLLFMNNYLIVSVELSSVWKWRFIDQMS